jgi:hypothetical protein
MHSSCVAKNSPGRAGIELAGIHDHVAVDDHIRDPARVAVRILEGRLVADRRGIEEREIGEIAWAKEAPRAQAQLGGRHPGHFRNRVLIGEEPCVAGVPAENARKRAVHARMRMAGCNRGGEVKPALSQSSAQPNAGTDISVDDAPVAAPQAKPFTPRA